MITFLYCLPLKVFMNKIFKGVLEEIKPKEGMPEVNNFLIRLNDSLKRKRIRAKAVVGGSFAKDTWLKGDLDVDIFVKFDLGYKELSKLLKKSLKGFHAECIHGSRDYFWVRNNVKYEIVPVLDIKKPQDAKNVTDFSPLHTAWVNKNGKKFKDEIRLAKKFLKAQGIYGAESYVRGFSGHVVDILVIYYRGFLNLLKASQKWKEKQVIDYYKVHKNKAFVKMNLSKMQGPLIVVDPVQPERNAAAALNQEKYDIFIRAAGRFLKTPSKSFFKEKQVDLRKLAGNVVILEVNTLPGKEDVIGAKLLKAFEFIKSGLSEFKISKSGWRWDKKQKATFWFVLKEKKLSDTFVRQGPPLGLKEAVKNFKKKHKKTFVKGRRAFAKIKRKNTKPEQIVKELLREKYLKEKIERCLIK